MLTPSAFVAPTCGVRSLLLGGTNFSCFRRPCLVVEITENLTSTKRITVITGVHSSDHHQYYHIVNTAYVAPFVELTTLPSCFLSGVRASHQSSASCAFDTHLLLRIRFLRKWPWITSSCTLKEHQVPPYTMLCITFMLIKEQLACRGSKYWGWGAGSDQNACDMEILLHEKEWDGCQYGSTG